MKKVAMVVAVLVAIAFVKFDANAQTGNVYLKWNADSKNGYSVGFFHGYMLLAYSSNKEMQPGVTYQQFSDIITRYIYNNPKERHLHMGVLSALAIGEAFPLDSLPPIRKQ